MIRGGIYLIRNLVTGLLYIGSTIHFSIRWKDHRRDLRRNNHYNPYLQNAWNKYGEQNFKFDVIEYIEDILKLKEREDYYIKFYNVLDPTLGYNLSPGVNNRSEWGYHQVAWNKNIWKFSIPEEVVISYYRNNHSIPECMKQFNLSYSNVHTLLLRSKVMRSKKESKALRDRLYPDIAREVGLKRIGKPSLLRGRKTTWIREPQSVAQKQQAKQTRFQKYGAYFSQESITKIKRSLAITRGKT